MEEQLISFDTAKLAKEKGFNIPVINYYTTVRGNGKNYLSYSEGYQTERLEESDWNNGQGCYPTMAEEVECSAPTQSLLQKWLREIYNFNICINWYKKGYYYYIFNTKKAALIQLPDSNKVSDTFKTYEQALEIGLQEALKLI